MVTPAARGSARWRAFLGLLWSAGPAPLLALGAAVLGAGLLPPAVILLSGRLVRAIPAAVAQGIGAPGARPALWALGWLMLALAGAAVCGGAMAQLARVVNSGFVLEVHHQVARALLGTPGMEVLDDPALADELQAVRDAEHRGILSMAAPALANAASMRLRGVAALAMLLGFRWWAPLVLGAAWYLTNRVYLKATEKGVTVQMSDGAVHLRRADYLRSLALDAPAARELRVFGLGEWVVGRYGEAWVSALEALWRGRRANRALTAAAAVALAAAHVLVLGALGMEAARGRLSPSALLVFAQAVIASVDAGMLGDWQWFLAQSLAAAGRVAGLRARLPAAPPAAPAAEPAAPAPGSARGVEVRVEGLRFTYRGRERPTLDGLDLVVPAGQSLAVVGENGAGKSTLVKLLCGLYEPQAGRVALDGGMEPRQARGRVAAIFQDFVRYPLTLRDNVAFGHLPLVGDEHALHGALSDAGGGELLSLLPAGWSTVLSREFEGGADLSGGQWQRVALARALAAVRGGAGLLVLDEPAASLDVRAETELFDRFLELTRGITTILVSHRLSSVRRADRIVVVHGGRVAEDGTHASLMRAGGRYARMYTLQAERFAAAPSQEAADA